MASAPFVPGTNLVGAPKWMTFGVTLSVLDVDSAPYFRSQAKDLALGLHLT